VRDLGEQNLTLLEQGRKSAVKAALDQVEQGDKEAQIEILSTGDVEASISAPITKAPKGFGWLKGGTVTAFGRLREKVAGIRMKKSL
jgi:hypothetical protein